MDERLTIWTNNDPSGPRQVQHEEERVFASVSDPSVRCTYADGVGRGDRHGYVVEVFFDEPRGISFT